MRDATDVDLASRPELVEAERLAAQDRVVEAVDLLAATNRAERSVEVETRLLDLRHEATNAFRPGPGRTPWPPPYPDPFPEVIGRVPEVDRADLDGDVLGGAVAHHGCLLVRGLFSDEQTARTVDAISQTAARRDGGVSDTPGETAWYRPFEPLPDDQRAVRGMVERRKGTWLGDSPTSTARVLDDLEDAGVIRAITTHLGERIFFSLQKSTLRTLAPENNFTGWHQDGSFLGREVRTMNVWVALSRCGGDYPSPGLEVVPRRVPDLLPQDGGLGAISISDETVNAAAGATPVIRPEFSPGDGLLFDERFVHRTHLGPDMTETRYALECWFFAPSHFAENYVSFLV
jgi:hypothetical protein